MSASAIDLFTDKTLIISSAYRNTGTETSFNIQLNQAISNVRTIQLQMCQVNNMVCPTEGSVFYWVEASYSATPFSFSFPDNTFYTVPEIATYIQTQMNAIGTLSYTVTINSSNYFQFSANGAFSLVCNQSNNNIFYILGLGAYANNIPVFPTSLPPKGYTFLNTSLSCPEPVNNRIAGIGISVTPLSSNSISNSPSNPSYNFYVPYLQNYSRVEYFSANSGFNQTCKYYNKGFSFSSMKVDIGVLIPSSKSVTFNHKLHSDIYFILNYTTYDDVRAILQSDTII